LILFLIVPFHRKWIWVSRTEFFVLNQVSGIWEHGLCYGIIHKQIGMYLSIPKNRKISVVKVPQNWRNWNSGSRNRWPIFRARWPILDSVFLSVGFVKIGGRFGEHGGRFWQQKIKQKRIFGPRFVQVLLRILLL
jgi:hypothetical protein